MGVILLRFAKSKILYFLLFLGLISFAMRSVSNNDLTVNLVEYIAAYNETSGYKYNGSILVAKGDRILLEEGYGMADFDNNIPNQPDTIFAIGSITKSFTALAIMQLHEKGLLDINDSISQYLHGNRYGEDITIHHLMTHTSGLPWDGKVLGETYIPLDENVEFINKLFLLFEPGTDYAYSNAGYQLLAAIIEQVSGKSYVDYMNDMVFNTLNMDDSFCGMDASYNEKQSIGYQIDATGRQRLSIYNFSSIIGSGNIYSTVKDLYKYDRALYSDVLLGEESIKAIFKPHWGHWSDGYGYGWQITESYGHRMISHAGSIGGGGYSSLMIRFPENEYVLIFLTNNSDKNALYEVSGVMSAILLGESYIIPGKLKVVDIKPETLQKYAGKYVTEEGNSIVLYYSNLKLYAKHEDDTAYVLLPVSETQFHYKDHENTILNFRFENDGSVAGIDGYSSGVIYDWVRVRNN